MLRIVRNRGRNRTLVGFDRQRAGLELIGVVLPWRVRPVVRAHVHDEHLDALRRFMSFLGEGCGVSKVLSIVAA